MKDKIRAAFEQIRADDALIDDTLAFLRKEADQRQHRSKSVRLPMRFVAVVAMTLLAVGLLSFINIYFTAYAHINIDINPSIELTLNRFDRVIDTIAFNDDGEKVLNELNLRGKTYSKAANLILSAIESDGYITDDALISVTVQAASNNKEQMLCENLLQLLNEKSLPRQVSAEIEVFPVSSEIWSNAHGCHMSPAKFLAIQALMDVDDDAAIEDYTDTSIRQIRRRTQECLNSHTQENGSNSEFRPQNEHAHGQSGGHGHDYRGH